MNRPGLASAAVLSSIVVPLATSCAPPPERQEVRVPRAPGGGAVVQSARAGVRPLKDGVAGVSIGAYHVCAVRRSGTVHCWGRNDDGQVGDGTRQQRNKPTLVE